MSGKRSPRSGTPSDVNRVRGGKNISAKDPIGIQAISTVQVETFEAVVHIPSPVVLGIEFDVELYLFGVFRYPVGMAPGDDSFTVSSTVTGNEHLRSHMTVVTIHARRPRQFEIV